MSNYREIVHDRLKQKEKLANAQSMMVSLFIGSSMILFLVLIAIWLTREQFEIKIPAILYWNTLLILFSSLTLELALKEIRNDNYKYANTLLVITIISGVVFAAIQINAWSSLLRLHPLGQNIFLPITILHFIHIIVGSIMLLSLKLKIETFHMKNMKLPKRVSYFWHYLGLVWLFILFVL